MSCGFIGFQQMSFPSGGGEGSVLIEQEVYEKKPLYFCYEPKMIYKIKF